MTLRSKIAMLVAEFLGSAILATVAINVSRSQIGIGYFVAIGVGLTYGLLVLALGAASGGHFNPAVTIGLWTLRRIQTIQAIAFVLVQMLGGLAAWQLANYFVGDVRSIAGDTFEWKVLIAEGVGTAVFAFMVAAAVFQRFEGRKAATLMGGGLIVGVIVASLASNGLLNPAVALGNQSWSRAYIFGPIIGSVIGMNLYVLLFAPASELVGRTARANRTAEPATTVTAVKTKTVAAPNRAAKTSRAAKTTKTTARKRTTTARKKR